MLVFLFGSFCFLQNAYATHNRAGEILIEQVGGCNSLTVQATIITWTKASSTAADRDTLTICWGDGTCEQVVRSNGNGLVLPNNIKYNTYVATHTYAGPARYRISMTDPNRIAGIVNVNPPSSDNVPFHIETIYTFQDPQFGGCNSTPVLLQPPVDVACIGKVFTHNPNAYDPDGDSLSYALIVPLQEEGTSVPNYSYPNQINPGIDNNLSLNSTTGDLVWATPQLRGEYNLAIVIISWRDGLPIDSTVRDMQIFVDDCDNRPPNVETIDEVCVVAGDSIAFPVYASDPDSGDLVKLTARGGPFAVSKSPSNFIVADSFQMPTVEGVFTWQTTCEHIANTPYSVVFKAEDNFGTQGLADLKTVRIKVVGPPPLDLQAEALQGQVHLSWEKPYKCEDADDNYFYGFSVWRREGTNPFPLDTCAPGLAGKGYTQISFFTKDMDNGRYVFVDSTVERGRTYCYRILGKFARFSFGGYPYNLVESLPSEEVCVQLPRDLPLLTHVDVKSTDISTGMIDVRWTKPIPMDLDTVINHGPYRFKLQRSMGQGQVAGSFQDIPGADWSVDEFWELNDTMFMDSGLNTLDESYSYRVGFYVRGEADPLGYSTPAASVFLNVGFGDKRIVLTWSERVPWSNYAHAIYRQDPNTGLFDSIGMTTTGKYTDYGLINGVEYCYRVEAEGTYGVDDIEGPLFNFSQENCAVPMDTIPPCPPMLLVDNLCTGAAVFPPDPPYENYLSWTNPIEECDDTDDVFFYSVFYHPTDSQGITLLTTVDGAESIDYVHELAQGLTGWYAVTATDTVGNESVFSNIVAVDNCPKYELPNVFTPNGDTQNELFTPFPGWRFIERVEFQVFNRWGNQVFATQDPALKWDGKDTQGKDLAEGSYYYVCKVYEQRVDGVVPQEGTLNGYIEIVRGR